MLFGTLHSIQCSPTWPITQKRKQILTSGARKRGKWRIFLFSRSMKSQRQFIVGILEHEFCIISDLKERIISLNLMSFMPWLAASFTLQRHTSWLTTRSIWFYWDFIQFSYALFCKWPKVSTPCDPRTFSVSLPLVLGLSWGNRAFSLAEPFH